MQHNLSELVKLPDYGGSRQHVFPSRHSLDWFLRNHKPGLIQAGALLMVTGQWFVIPERFDAYVVEAGSKAAQRHSEVV